MSHCLHLPSVSNFPMKKRDKNTTLSGVSIAHDSDALEFLTTPLNKYLEPPIFLTNFHSPWRLGELTDSCHCMHSLSIASVIPATWIKMYTMRILIINCDKIQGKSQIVLVSQGGHSWRKRSVCPTVKKFKKQFWHLLSSSFSKILFFTWEKKLSLTICSEDKRVTFL